LRFSRAGRQEVKIEAVDLNVVMEDVKDSLATLLSDLKAEIKIPATLPIVLGDRTNMYEILSNLISNGIKYNDKEKKQITVNWDPGREGRHIIKISDNGIGISQDHYDLVFKIFKRLHGQEKYGGGTGAGLTVAKKLIERQDGEIWLDSVLGEGTTFYFTLRGV
jgi:light-regulated signal transduction histidine kinase (bacteriophytochrome)